MFKKNENGFTIVEVLIVLAIAGVIMLIVFLAVPGLERSNRNTQRKADAARVLAAISEFSSNNNGTLPNVLTQASGSSSVLICTTTGTSCTVGSGTQSVSVSAFKNTQEVTEATAASDAGNSDNRLTDTLDIATDAICTGNNVGAGSSSRSYAAVFEIETSTGTSPMCVQS